MTTSEQQAVPVAQEDIEFAEKFGNVWLEGSTVAKMALAHQVALHRHRLDTIEPARKADRFDPSLPCKSGEGAGEEWHDMEGVPRDGTIVQLRSALRLNRSVFLAAYVRPTGLVGKAWLPVKGQSCGDFPWKDHEVEAWRPAPTAALAPDATQTLEPQEWRENVEELLSNYDRTIRARPGGGPEDLILSLVLTFTRMKSELAALTPDATQTREAELEVALRAWEPEGDDRVRPLLLAEADRRDALEYNVTDASHVIAFLLHRLDVALAHGQTMPFAQTREVEGAWLPISDDAKSGAMVELVVDYSDGDYPLADGILACTIGFNTLEDTGEDEWKFAGWCWTHDHFVQGKGTPVAWRPSRLNATDDGLGALPARAALNGRGGA